MDQSPLSQIGERVAQNLSIFAPVSPQAESIRGLSILVFAITGFIFLVVEAILIYCILRTTRRPEGDKTEPPQVYGSQPIEIAWTAAPTLVVFLLTLVTARTLWTFHLTPAPTVGVSDNALYVTVVGHQWWWEFIYESYDGKTLDFTTANELHIPTSDPNTPPVYLTLKSADVCHSFWVPRLAGKTDLIPAHTNSMWFQTEQPGLYLGQCAEYCGTQHANMLLRVVAEPASQFQQWLDREAKPAVEDPAVASGKTAFLDQTCINCHRVRGTRAQGTYAPDLTHFMARQTLASGIVPNTKAELVQWIDDPQETKPGCLMPAFGLSKIDRDLIVRYLQTLR